MATTGKKLLRQASWAERSRDGQIAKTKIALGQSQGTIRVQSYVPPVGALVRRLLACDRGRGDRAKRLTGPIPQQSVPHRGIIIVLIMGHNNHTALTIIKYQLHHLLRSASVLCCTAYVHTEVLALKHLHANTVETRNAPRVGERRRWTSGSTTEVLGGVSDGQSGQSPRRGTERG